MFVRWRQRSRPWGRIGCCRAGPPSEKGRLSRGPGGRDDRGRRESAKVELEVLKVSFREALPSKREEGVVLKKWLLLNREPGGGLITVEHGCAGYGRVLREMDVKAETAGVVDGVFDGLVVLEREAREDVDTDLAGRKAGVEKKREGGLEGLGGYLSARGSLEGGVDGFETETDLPEAALEEESRRLCVQKGGVERVGVVNLHGGVELGEAGEEGLCVAMSGREERVIVQHKAVHTPGLPVTDL